MIGALWSVALISTTPFAIVSHTEVAIFYTGSNVTVCRTRMNEDWQRGYAVLSLVMFFCVPFIILCVLYSIISHRITTETSQLRNTGNSVARRATIRSRHRSAFMIGVIIVLFFVCLLPLKVYSMWMIFSDTSSVESLGFENFQNLSCFVRIMFYMNSAINPVVYNIMSSKFRLAFVKVTGIGGAEVFLWSQHHTASTRAMTRYPLPTSSETAMQADGTYIRMKNLKITYKSSAV